MMSDTEEDEEYEIERILADDVVDDKTFYLVKWKGYDDKECTWEPAENFTSSASIKEWRDQKAQGLGLDDDFLSRLQQKMDEFQTQNLQPDVRPTESDTEVGLERPNKKSKRERDTGTALPHQRLMTTLVPLRRKGVALPVKQVSASRAISTTPRLKKSTINRLAKPIKSLDYATKQDSAGRAGQRFRNLSHMNNFRKKARQEPPPNIPSDRLKRVEDFGIGREAAHVLPVLMKNTSDHDDSPLFIPESHDPPLRREPSPARSDSVFFPPAKVDHQLTLPNNDARSEPSGDIDGTKRPDLSKTSNLPLEQDVGRAVLKERSDAADVTGARTTSAISDGQSKQASTPTEMTSLVSEDIISNSLSKHTVTSPGATSSLPSLGSTSRGSNNNVVHPIARGFRTVPPVTFPLAPLPAPATKFYAKNGRSWYRGDVMCTFTMGGPIGDAAVIHLPHYPYGAHLVALKVGPLLNLKFEPNPYNMREFEEAFQNHYNSIEALGLVDPCPDTQAVFDEFASYLELHDSAAVLHYPDVNVNLSILLYSIDANSWKQTGWHPARFGRPRLHIAFIPRLIPRVITRSPLATKLTPTTQFTPSQRLTIEPTVDQTTYTQPLRAQPDGLPERNSRPPSLPNEVTRPHIENVGTRGTPGSPLARSNHFRSLPPSPSTDYNSNEASPAAITPRSPRSNSGLIRDPRIRRKSTNTDTRPPAEATAPGSEVRSHARQHRLNFQNLTALNHASLKAKIDPKKARFFLSFSRTCPEDAAMIQKWLEQYTASSNIYSDSELHGWARSKERSDTRMLIILFHAEHPNYNQLPGLGLVLASDFQMCFLLSFNQGHNDTMDVSHVRYQRIFSRATLYLITESMIINHLAKTLAILKYFDDSKRPGYAIMMRPNVEKWLLEHSARERNEDVQNKLIDLLVLIRSLRPTSDILMNADCDDDLQTIESERGHDDVVYNSYILSPQNIPNYDKTSTNSAASLGEDVTLSINPNQALADRDDLLRSFFYNYTAANAAKTRRFLDFIPKSQWQSHVANLKDQENSRTLDCGHVHFWELETFVSKFCVPRPDKKQRDENHTTLPKAARHDTKKAVNGN